MADNPFILNADDYYGKRDYNIVKGALEDAAHFLSRTTGDDYDTCLAYAKKTMLPGGELGMKDPAVRMLHRDNGTDRERATTTFTSYLKHVQDNNLLMAPTMTVYQREEVEPSILSEYIADRIGERKVYKKEMFVARQKGDRVAQSIADSQQSSCKIDANSLSGAHNSEHSILFIKSAHSTLTTTCRMSTAYANGNNEKFIQGSRHYWKPEVVYTNIASICNMVDLEAIDKVVSVYGLVYPTTDQVMTCIRRSSKRYWSSDGNMARIRRYVDGLTPTERAAFMYIGDLYHLALLNETAVRKLIGCFITPPTESVASPDDVIKGMDDDMKVYMSVMLQDVFRGKKFEDIKTKNPQGWQRIADQVTKVHDSLKQYELLIQTFWTSPVAPASVAVLPEAVRLSVVAGDTDSTIFTVQWWVEWYLGKVEFTETAYRVSATVAYFTSQMVVHLLATMSANMGISKKHLFKIAMKNEFCFPLFVPTNRSKHYFAYQLAKEGNVFSELELELKGAELRSSQTPAPVKKMEMQLIRDLMDEVLETSELSAKNLQFRIADIEHQIRSDIKNNSASWFRTRQLKDKDTYTNPYSSIWQYYEMWNEVFGPKYGEVDPPPYMAVSFKVSAKNSTEIQTWLDSITDLDVRSRLKGWMERRNKKQMSEIMLPLSVVNRVGVPDELIEGANLSKVIYTIMSPFYIILETLGFYYHTKPFIDLVSDQISKEEVDAHFKRVPA